VSRDEKVNPFVPPKRYATAQADYLAPRAGHGGPAGGSTLHFVAGLPRAGATVLMTVLHQNPRLHAAPVSGLGHLFHEIVLNWGQNPYHQELDEPGALERVLGGVLASYHKTERPIILDKQRMWVAALPLLETVLERRVKVIAPVRPLPEIVASFEALRRRTPGFKTSADRQLGNATSVRTRTDLLLSEQGTLGQALGALRAAVEGGYRDRILFVDYNRFLSDPVGQLHRIYSFLEERPFDHDLGKIEPLGEFDSRAQGWIGLHDVRPSLRRASVDPRQVLGDDVYRSLVGPAPWDAFSAE